MGFLFPAFPPFEILLIAESSPGEKNVLCTMAVNPINDKN